MALGEEQDCRRVSMNGQHESGWQWGGLSWGFALASACSNERKQHPLGSSFKEEGKNANLFSAIVLLDYTRTILCFALLLRPRQKAHFSKFSKAFAEQPLALLACCGMLLPADKEKQAPYSQIGSTAEAPTRNFGQVGALRPLCRRLSNVAPLHWHFGQCKTDTNNPQME